MPVPTLSRDHRAAQARRSDRAGREARQLWQRLDTADVRGSWLTILPDLVRMVAAAQVAAAALASGYLEELLGADAPAVAQPVPEALGGVASDGRDLETLLTQPLITMLDRIGRGASPSRAMAAGLLQLEAITRTQVADAGRAGDQVAVAARPACVAYTRVVELPACDRCIVLAGREYPWSTGFQRHPQCDCSMVPMRPGDRTTGDDPRAVFADMTEAEQDRRFGPDAAAAIREGADIGQVVNARRGMQSPTDQRRGRYTTEGTTARGVAGRRLGDLTRDGGRYRRSRRPRLMPEAIMRDADNRQHAIELLYDNGYLDQRPNLETA